MTHEAVEGESPPPFLRRTLTYIISAKQQLGNPHAESCKPFHFHLREKTKIGKSLFSRKFDKSICPICEFNGIFVQGLWIHLMTTHGQQYQFDFVESSNLGEQHSFQQHHITAREIPESMDPKAKNNRSNISNNSACIDNGDSILNLHTRMTGSELVYWHNAPEGVHTTARELEHLGADASTKLQKMPIRDYYHFSTLEQMEIGEWMMSDDSDDEVNEAWKKRVGDALLDEFEDVSSNEKVFFKLWNDHMRSQIVIPEKDLPRHCLAFVEKYAVGLKADHLEEQLIYHLSNMWDEGHISRSHIIEVMLRYSELTESC